MPVTLDPAVCHIAGCDQPPTQVCDRCERPCCGVHAQRISIERRLDSLGRRGLARIPTRRESYLLCMMCLKNRRPFAGLPASKTGAQRGS
jgi:hypothetical protein